MRTLPTLLVTSFAVLGVLGCTDDDTTSPGSTEPLSPGAFARAAVRIELCETPRYIGKDSFQVQYELGLIASTAEREAAEAWVACINGASDCAGVLRCEGFDLDAPCDAATFQARCEGNIAVECREIGPGDGWGALALEKSTDCAARFPGGTCSSQGFAGCTPPTCTESYTRCEDDSIVECFAGTEALRTRCPHGTTCMEVGGEPRCVVPGAACEAAHCDGDDWVLCAYGFETARLDCSALAVGATCDGMAFVPCTGPASWCQDGGEFTGRCAGNTAEVCLRGMVVTYDCGSFLGGRCNEGNATTEGICVSSASPWKQR